VVPNVQHRNAYLGLAGFNELNDQFGVRLVVGLDRIVAGLGARASVDYARQSPITQGAVAAAAHLYYRFGSGGFSVYAGAGGGFQFNILSAPNANQGPFASGLLGVELAVTDAFGVFIEGTADYYFNPPPTAVYQQFYPTVGLGLNVRF